ncbi:MAG: alpha/beta hydrolase [Acidimicrobiia bacterium]
MALWPDEYEGLRDEARQMIDVILSTFVGGATGEMPTDQAGRVRFMRRTLAALESQAPSGRDETIAGVPCRVFDPTTAPRGTYLHFHGGAMLLGSPRLNDTDNAGLCERLGVRVVSVDYRLAPEHPYPAGSDDCLAVAQWLLDDEHGPVVVGGESAGGYYAALTLLRIRDELGAVDRVTGANLIFGVYDLSGTPTARGTRPTELPDLLDDAMSGFINECYLPGRSVEDARDPAVSPLYVDLGGLPPALFTVGSADHLLDDSLFMAARWEAYGNDAELAVYPDCPHGFTGFPMELAKRARERIDAFLDRAFTTTG